MFKEIKYFLFIIIIFLFFFFVGKHYFSDQNKKKSYRSFNNINDKIDLYSNDLPVLGNDTKDIIEYVKNTNNKKKKKYSFWELIDKND